MKFSNLAAYLERLEGTASRNEITRILAEVLTRAEAREIDQVCYLLSGELLPAYRGVEFSVAEKTMSKILARAYDRSEEEIRRRFGSVGDHGTLARELALSAHHRIGGLSVSQVYDRLLAAAHASGEGSQARRVKELSFLLTRLDPLSAKFVARIPLGKLRLGFSDATMLDALSVMATGDKSARNRIEAAYNVTADIGAIARRLKVGGLRALERLGATPGIPIRPSLAERVASVEQMILKAGPLVAVEPKLDGLRTQIHVWHVRGRKQAALFSRNLENTTAMFPEIAKGARRLGVRSAILDSEVIGFDVKTGRFAPFQETVQRKRKHDIAAFVKKIPLVAFVFDALYLDGSSLLDRPFSERRKILARFLGRPGAHGALRMDTQRVTSEPAVIASELASSVRKGLEGLVVKNLRSPYQAGSRGFHWIKLKATTAGLARLRTGAGHGRPPDTVDCVVMGAYKGRGKRAEFGIGGFLLGVRGSDERYYSISRLGSGLSDAEFREAHSRIKALETAEQPKEYVVLNEMAPDVWVRPSIVMEILADEVSLSSRHSAGARAGARGYSLRFPRLVRFRDDKDPIDATTVREVASMYHRQKA